MVAKKEKRKFANFLVTTMVIASIAFAYLAITVQSDRWANLWSDAFGFTGIATFTVLIGYIYFRVKKWI